MSTQYVPVQWTARKIFYDAIVVVAVAIYIVLFGVVTRWLHSGDGVLTGQIVSMRAWGSCAFLMLTLILCIGPLARLSPKFIPLLYNRRHFGVLMFFVAAMHANTVLGYYYNYTGDLDRVSALFLSDNEFTGASWPFPLFGLAALLYLAVMAATSHDFWQRTIGPAAWKTLHMGVYLVFALAVLHVAFGLMKSEPHPMNAALVFGSVVLVGGLHLLAARRSLACEREEVAWVEFDGERYVDAGRPEDIPEGRARALCIPGHERIAVVRWQGKVAALHGHCAHQNGPLYEGKVIDGSLTCPWHGWQYRPEDGQSPPPFTEKIPTYEVRLKDGRILVRPVALAPGTATAPAEFDVAVARLAREEPS